MELPSDSGTSTTAANPPQKPSSGLKKLLGPFIVAATVAVKFFAKLKFILLPALKFLPLILKSGGTMLLMIWVYATMWGWKFAVGFVLLLRSEEHTSELQSLF